MKKYFLIFFIILFELHGIGAKKFVREDWNPSVKKGWVWCRNRESHPGQQCCDSIGRTPLEIPMLGAVNTQATEVNGFGSTCTDSCECNTILPEVTCKITPDCAEKVGPYFKCYKGHCEFPCLIDNDCERMFGKDFICEKKSQDQSALYRFCKRKKKP